LIALIINARPSWASRPERRRTASQARTARRRCRLRATVEQTAVRPIPPDGGTGLERPVSHENCPFTSSVHRTTLLFTMSAKRQNALVAFCKPLFFKQAVFLRPASAS